MRPRAAGLRGRAFEGRAGLFVLERIGFERLGCVFRVPPLVWAVEAGYRLVARHRPFFARFCFRR